MNSLFSIEGKVALVTGGAQGMGRMIAEGLLRAGAKVYISSRKADICAAAVEELSQLGSCIGLVGDLDSAEAVIDLAARLKAQEIRLDILINNAGRTWGAPLESFPDKAWAPVMTVNVQAPFTLVRELLPLLRSTATQESPARVINIGSLAGAMAEPIKAYSYAASKAAIHHLSRVLAAELAPENVTVNAIVPGYFPTKMTAHIREEEGLATELLMRIPMRRLGTAEDIVGLCIFLSSRAGAYITGSELSLDGGMLGCH